MALTTQLYGCRCGGEHPLVYRQFNMNVIGPCPAITDDLLHVVIPYRAPGQTPPVAYYRIGDPAWEPAPQKPAQAHAPESRRKPVPKGA